MATAVARWTEMLSQWAIPAEILAAAPESPWHHDVARFTRRTALYLSGPLTPTHLAALAALPEGGLVLDVGVGVGATSLPLLDKASWIVGVDESREMLDAFSAAAQDEGLGHAEVQGHWPEVAGSVAPADVVVCGHVLYNVGELAPFITALSSHARHAVVVEVTSQHPQSVSGPLWRQFWGIERPDKPDVSDLVAALTELGVEPSVERWARPAEPPLTPEERAGTVAALRRRLCLTADRDPEVDAALGPEPVLSYPELVTLAWSP